MTLGIKSAIICSGLSLLLTLLTAPKTLAAGNAPLNVVSSFSIITDLAQNVGGDHVHITTLVGPDGDTHAYEPQPADARAVAQADVVLANGLQLEGFLPRLVQASGTRAPIVKLADGIHALPSPEVHGHDRDHDGHEHDHAHGPSDPHAWQSVPNAQVYVSHIASAFCAADADHCNDYRKNAADYNEELRALDEGVRMAIAGLPADKRTVITSHDAFGYFGHEYGLTLLAPEGVSTASEASAADVASLIRQVREDQAAAVFVENIRNPRLVQQIASEAGVQVGGTLYSDALSAADGPAPTYIRMMEYNVETIREAITGD